MSFRCERLARVDLELREHPLRVVEHRVRADSETLRDLAVSKPWARRKVTSAPGARPGVREEA